MPEPAPTHFECSIPILRVEDLAASVGFYVKVLGFSIDWQEPGIMTSVSRGRGCLILSQRSQGQRGTWVWIGVGDAQTLFDEYTRAGAAISLPPTNFPWALEMHVEDPDGHVLRFGSEPLSDRPYGDWPQPRGPSDARARPTERG